ncbi:MAG: hypothetical protein NT033_03385 [Candidatus Omnitrophica bacterium]|nr:hypothetical protein [Candidatus Omnitrophota bacterium]
MIVKVILFNLLLSITFIFAIELGVRILFPNIFCVGIDKNFFEYKKFGDTYGFKKNIKGVIFGKEFITGDLGFPINPKSTLTNQAKHTILVLGDSISFALGVEANNAFPFLLERRLKKGYRIINASISGYGVEDYYNILKDLLPRMDFEGIIISLSINDFTALSQTFIIKNFNRQLQRKRIIQNPFLRSIIYVNNYFFDFNAFLREHSKAYMLIRRLFLDSSKIYFLAEKETFEHADIKNYISDSLLKINNLAVKNGKWIIFFVLPYKEQLRQDAKSDDFKPQARINEVASEEFLSVVDCCPLLKKFIESSGVKLNTLYLSPEDGIHFSLLGHKVISEIITDELSHRGLAQ